MKILILGAGAVGGYFGGRLLEKGADVTFLVRPNRKKILKENGLVVHSIHGNIHVQPKTITSGEELGTHFDLILLTPKAYHLQESIEAIRPYAGPSTLILPVLNGISHMDALQQSFGKDKVLGGLCLIESTLNEQGEVVQTSPVHDLVYGEWPHGKSERLKELEELCKDTKAVFRSSEYIERDMWHKYLFIAAFSGVTTLMNSAIGPIRETVYGLEIIERLLREIEAIMRAEGAPLDENILEKQMNIFYNQKGSMKSSMLRDMEKGTSIEADHLQGYLLSLAKKHRIDSPILKVVYHNLKIYEKKLL